MADEPGFAELNLPRYRFRFRDAEGKTKIFDEIRNKYFIVSPEEWVRQNFIRYLIQEKKYPKTLMAVEKKVMVNGLSQRFDLLVYDRKGNPYLVAEFKSPGVKITQDTFSQAVRYNSNLKVPLILVSNGLDHFICRIDYSLQTVSYLKEIPDFETG